MVLYLKRSQIDIHVTGVFIRNRVHVHDRGLLAKITETKNAPLSLEQTLYWRNGSIFDNINCGRNDRKIASCFYSKVKLLHINSTARIIEVGIYLYDGYNNTKTNGGDVILLWAEEVPSGGRAPGHVTDHMNGSYSGSVRVHWSGQTKIFVKLASAKENVCLRFKAMEKYGNSVYALKTPYGIYGQFVHLSSIEYTRCSPQNFVYGYKSLCNFTSLNGGFSWFCGQPSKKGFSCSSFNGYQMNPYNKSELVPNQPTGEVINENGHCVFNDSVLQVAADQNHGVLSAERSLNVPKCSERPKKDSWLEQRPTGYTTNQTWIFNNCLNTLKYNADNLSKCLCGKNITIIGDSTVRQYLETIADVMKIKIHLSRFRKSAYSAKFNIHVSWIRHEMPYHGMKLLKQQNVMKTSTFHLNELANDKSDGAPGNNSVVVVHYGAHLQAFPPDAYRSRLQSLVKALKQLLAKKPATQIFVKGATPAIDDKKWFDVRIALIYNEILYEEFADLQNHVVYLDVFSIFVANNVQLLHPTGQAMHNQIQQLLAYLC